MAEMKELKCNNCGGRLRRETNLMLRCINCGIERFIPTNHLEFSIFEADSLIDEDKFEEAEVKYEKIISQNVTLSDAYFGLLRAKYGIKVETDNEGKDVYTCHKMTVDSFTHDPYFKKLINHSETEDLKAKYIQMGKTIDGVKSKVESLYKHEKPYDIFISYKDTEIDPNTGRRIRTEDSQRLDALYYYLTNDLGYRVFFSKYSLQAHAGEYYEPYIYHALNTCKVFILYASNEKYLTSKWVENEYTRYLKMMQKGQKAQNSFIFCYKNIDMYNAPIMIRNRQGIEDNMMLLPNLQKTIKRVITKEQEKPKVVIKESITEESLYKEVKDLISKGKFVSAKEKIAILNSMYPNDPNLKFTIFMCDYKYSSLSEIRYDEASSTLVNIVPLIEVEQREEIYANCYKYFESTINSNTNTCNLHIFNLLLTSKGIYKNKAINLVFTNIKQRNNFSLLDVILKGVNNSETYIKAGLLSLKGRSLVEAKRIKEAEAVLNECYDIAGQNANSIRLELYVRCRTTNPEELGEAIVTNNLYNLVALLIEKTQQDSRIERVSEFIKLFESNIDKNRHVSRSTNMIIDLVRYYDNSIKSTAALNRIGAKLISKKYPQLANVVYTKSVEYSPTYEGYIGLTLIEFDVRSEEELKTINKNYRNSKNYMNALKYASVNKMSSLKEAGERHEKKLYAESKSKLLKTDKKASFIYSILIPALFLVLSILTNKFFLFGFINGFTTIGIITIIVLCALFSQSSMKVALAISKSLPYFIGALVIIFVFAFGYRYNEIESEIYSIFNNEGIMSVILKLYTYFLTKGPVYIILLLSVIALVTNILRLCYKFMVTQKSVFSLVVSIIIQTVILTALLSFGLVGALYLDKQFGIINNLPEMIFIVLSSIICSIILGSFVSNLLSYKIIKNNRKAETLRIASYDVIVSRTLLYTGIVIIIVLLAMIVIQITY